MAEKGIGAARGGEGRPGPTIVDINSGYMRDDEGLANMYEGRTEALFTPDEYELYRSTIERIRHTVGATFGLEEGYPIFTAPTFITRLRHHEDWQPQSMHDVYWMEHVDKNNTAHYDYSVRSSPSLSPPPTHPPTNSLPRSLPLAPSLPLASPRGCCT
jgi:hypothetical protein